MIKTFEELGFNFELSMSGGVKITHPNVDCPVSLSTAVIIAKEMIKDAKQHIVSVGFYTVYNVKINGDISPDDAVERVKRYYHEHDIDGIKIIGDCADSCGNDVLIQYEGMI